MSNLILWLATYALHSTVFFLGAWAFDRFATGASPALRVTVWRTAMIAAVISASLHVGGYLPSRTIDLTVPVVQSSAPEIAPVERIEAPIASAPITTSPVAADERWSMPSLSLPSTTPLLLIVWALGAELLSMRIGFVILAARGQLKGRRPIVQGSIFERIQVLAAEIGLPRLPAVSVSEHINGPITLPTGEICIPTWAYEKFPQAQLDAMIAHEMAHVLRKDALWLTAGMTLQALLFFQPLHMLARRRHAYLAELAADDWAAAHAGSGRPLAECLSAFAHITYARRDPEFAAAMAAGESTLVSRVSRLLERTVLKHGVPTFGSRAAVWAVAAALAIIVPAVTLSTEAIAYRTGNTNIDDRENGDITVTSAITTNDYKLTVMASGRFALAADGSGLASISDGSTFDATLDNAGGHRRVRFNGSAGREFWLEGVARPWGPGADKFVAELMPIIFRETGLQTKERVAYLASQKDPDAFFDEVALVTSDGIQSRYLQAYTALGPLSAANYQHVLELTKDIGSDGELNRTLTAINATQKPTGERLAMLINAASTIDSDGELRRLLEAVTASAEMTDRIITAYLARAETIDSDGELRGVLEAMVSRKDSQKPSAERLAQLLGIALSIDSDGEVHGLLDTVAAASPNMPRPVVTAYLRSAETIGSDGELHGALKTLLSREGLQPEQIAHALNIAADNIGSDGEMSALLSDIPNLPKNHPAVRDALRRALETIGSDSQRKRVEAAVE